MKTDVNVPFALHWNGKELELRAKTIMRKKNFKSSNKKFAVETFGHGYPTKEDMKKIKYSEIVTRTIN